MPEVTLEELEWQWPDWKIWRTETMWNATRRGPKPARPAGFFSRLGELEMTLLEDGPFELIAALETQAKIEDEIKSKLKAVQAVTA